MYLVFQILYFSFSGSFGGSNGLGTPPTTIKVKDSAHNGPLGSLGDCNRTNFQPIVSKNKESARVWAGRNFFKNLGQFSGISYSLTQSWSKMGPITVSRAPKGSVVCGILDFYGGWGSPEPVGAQKRAGKRKI